MNDLREKTVSGGRLNVANAMDLISDDFYRFRAESGQKLLIQTKPPQGAMMDSLNLAIQLFAPDGSIVAEDDDSGVALHPRISHRVDSAGEFLVRVFGSESGTRGEYLLQLQVDEKIAGDFDGNGRLDVNDIDFFNLAIRLGIDSLEFDLDGDQRITTKDRDTLIHEVIGTNYGDADLDGSFNTRDLISIFQIDEYEDATSQNSTWADGDWDGDGDFTSRDLVLAFQDDAFVET